MQKTTPEDYEFVIRILHHRKGLTDQEVGEWMKDPEHLRLLEDVAAVRTIAGSFQEEHLAGEHKRLYAKLHRVSRIRWGVAVAASVILAWGCLHFFRNTVEQTVVSVAVNTGIEPGATKARLILPDGEVVDLHSWERKIVTTGAGIIRNDSVEGLKYRSENPVPGNEQYHILQVPVGGFYKLELADGTRVWLNAGTELCYPAQFSGEERNVFLRGEGYFEVARDEEKRFNVHIGPSVVSVLGTSFNISAYPEEKELCTTLVTGRVSFQGEQDGPSVSLQPGQQCVMEMATGKTRVREVDTGIFTSWVDGRFVFRFMKLENIMRQLQRWYDFELTYRDPEIKAYEFRGVVQRDSRIEDVFRAIELATDVRFEITGKQVTVEKR